MTRAIAVDLGTRRIGVSVSDSSGTMAFPRPFLARSGDRAADHRSILEVVDDVGADVIVVGLPIGLDGRRGRAARGIEEEAAELAAALAGRGVDVELFDERFTTVEAHAVLSSAGKDTRARRNRVDSAAATVLLQAWLDGR